MAASYPGAVKTFTTKAAGGAILAAHINDLQDEVVAVETQLGTNAGAWLNWTPTVTFAGGTTDPSSTTLQYARYTQIGKTVIANADYLFGSGGNRTEYMFTLPVSPVQTYGAAIGYESIKTAFTEPTKVSISKTGTLITVYVPLQDKSGHVMFSATYEVA